MNRKHHSHMQCHGDCRRQNHCNGFNHGCHNCQPHGYQDMCRHHEPRKIFLQHPPSVNVNSVNITREHVKDITVRTSINTSNIADPSLNHENQSMKCMAHRKSVMASEKAQPNNIKTS